MGLILNYNLIFTNFCGPRWLWSLFGTNFCDFLHKRMVINNEANPIFSTFLLVTSQHKMWWSFSVFFFLIIIFLPFPSANWCQHWFEFFPNPPVNILGMVENILVHHDKRLMEHFVNCNVTSQVTYALFCFPVPTVNDCLDYFDWFRLFQMYAWPLLQTLLSEVLTKDEWLRAWDNIFSNHPSFLLFVVVAYVIVSRKALLQCTRKEDFEVWNGLKILKRKCFRHDFLASMMAWN